MSIDRERNTQEEMDEIHAEIERRNPSQSDDELRQKIDQIFLGDISELEIDDVMHLFATHLRAELQALREKSRSFNGYLKTDGLSIEAIPLAALDEVIEKYGSEGVR